MKLSPLEREMLDGAHGEPRRIDPQSGEVRILDEGSSAAGPDDHVQ